MSRPINSLQENASAFFDKTYLKYKNQMKCAEGCSKCCYTDISIFEIESELIFEWFKNQNEIEKKILKNLWSAPHDSGACSMLYNGRCSIYEARPLICRTQGVPLYLAQENLLDYCPLNFNEGDPPREDWLNLERMNTLLSLAAQSIKKDQRIKIKKIKNELLII